MAGEGGKRLREINPCVAMVLSDKDMRSGTAVREKTSCFWREQYALNSQERNT